ncbi:hypothetical protein ABIF33_001110 [Bradyrhizobium elkanii]|nr:hypothetical protein [Bradyrhizobium elkanii]
MTTVKGQLLQMLQTVATALGSALRERLVFVGGGGTTALFITDDITLEGVRATDDVDLIVDLVGFAEWAKLQDELRQKGFAESQDDTVICRMRLGDLKVDFMPDDEDILGFSNRWYAKGIETAVTVPLRSRRMRRPHLGFERLAFIALTSARMALIDSHLARRWSASRKLALPPWRRGDIARS